MTRSSPPPTRLITVPPTIRQPKHIHFTHPEGVTPPLPRSAAGLANHRPVATLHMPPHTTGNMTCATKVVLLEIPVAISLPRRAEFHSKKRDARLGRSR